MIKHKFATALTIACAALFISACSSNEEPKKPAPPAEQPTSLNPQDKVPQTSTKDLVVEMEKAYRRGAGIDGEGDKHFLDANCNPANSSPLIGNARYDRSHQDSRPATYNSDIMSRFRQGSIKDYSYYELSRWERFCDYGHNMDRLDWKFIKEAAQGRHNFPTELSGKCNPPSDSQLRRHGL